VAVDTVDSVTPSILSLLDQTDLVDMYTARSNH